MRSGDRPGLQNRRVAPSGVAGGFDPHSLPPFFNELAAGAISLQSVSVLESQTHHLAVRLRHLISDHVTVYVHGRSDVSVTH